MTKQNVQLVFLLALATAMVAGGQTITSSIVGTVVDPSDSAVAGATLTLRHVATGAERRAETDTRGSFVFTNLEPGEYVLTVTAAGFKALERKGLTLSASSTLPLGTLVLEVGTLSESITVTAAAQAVQTASSERSAVLTSNRVENLLTKSRNVMSLMALLPGVVDANEGAVDSLTRSWNLSVQGKRFNTNSLTLDGVALNSWGLGNAFDVAVSQDAVAEVRVLVSSYQAEYGRRSGANIALVTKSGGQDYHGLFSYFKRHEQFNANNFFRNRTSQPKPRYRYNTWTYNIGGPAYIPGKFNKNKDKLFFFWNQEFWPLETTVDGSVTMPSPMEKMGNFSQTLDLNNRLIVVRDPYSREPLPANIMPASRINSNGQALLKVFPDPNFLDRNISKGNYNYLFTTPVSKPTRMETLRVDYNANAMMRFAFSLSDYLNDQKGMMGLDTGGSNWPQFGKGYSFFGQNILVRHTSVIQATLINELSIGFTRRPQKNTVIQEELRRNQRKTVGFTAGQFNPTNNPLDIIPDAYFGDVPNAAYLRQEGRFPFFQNGKVLSFTDTVSKVLNRHALKVGITGDFLRHHARLDGPLPFGRFDFGRNTVNPLDTNYAYSNVLFGVFSTYQESNLGPIVRWRQANVEWFVQDTWRTRRLTLEYGVRFQAIGPMWDAKGFTATFTFEKFDAARQVRLIEPVMAGGRRVGYNPATGEILPEALIGAIAPGSGNPWNGMLVVADSPDYPRGLYERRKVQAAPRFGFAYDLSGNGQTALRGGFGVFFDHPGWNVYEPFSGLPPLVITPTIYYGELSTFLSSAGFVFPQSVNSADRKSKYPMVMDYQLSIQQRLPFATVLDVGYSSSLGRHLFWTRELNPVPMGRRFDPAYFDPTRPRTSLPTAFLTPLRGYTGIVQYEAAASSNYHALQVAANRGFASGFQYGVAWTWSKALGFVDADRGSISPFVSARVWNYGLATFDRTHNFKLNWVWEVPRTGWGNPLGKAVLNGWQVSGMASFVSGTPLGIGWTSVTGVDVTGTPSQSARVVVTGNPVLPKGQRTFSRNFRTDVFQMPAVGTVGNAAKTLIRGPGINNWDVAVFKSFSIAERAKIQYRCEFYNFFNHTQFSGLDTTARFDAQGNQVNQRFGEFTSARAARVIQMALRVSF